MNKQAVIAALKQRADMNGDGKVDMLDVESIIHRVDTTVHAEGQKSPWVLVVCTAVAASVASVILTRLFC